MNHKLKNIIISNRQLILLINKIFNLFYKRKYEKIIKERANLSIFDYIGLVKEIPYAPEELVIDNNLYGIAHILKEYIGINPRASFLDAYIEHGVFFGSLVRDDQKIWPVSQNITFGDQRVMHLRASGINKEIVPIGPFIHYAKGLLNNEQSRKIKSELGRVLLVFPSHSIKGVQSKYDTQLFIENIELVKKDFDSVLVSLYWLDAMNEEISSIYNAKGYKIVTSGHRFDCNFLNRQKSIIELSDMTMSNNVGTHIGYCIHMNKPHYIFQQKVEDVGLNASRQKHFDAVRNSTELIETKDKEMDEVINAFSEFNLHITNEQRMIVDKYWGTSYIMTREKLKEKLIVR